FDAWAVDGSIRDAADVVAQFVQRGGNIVSLYGSTVRAETAPADFWIEDEARGVVPNLAAYPNVVAF
ncbi:MAG: hypothetical protein ACREQ5_17395, partial [Candidatus Dormibacteria bacterium]